MSETMPKIYIVDDEASVRRALVRLLAAHGHCAIPFSSANDFFAAVDPDSEPACLLLDLEMPGVNGIALQQMLREKLPIIILTGHADVPLTVVAMQAGAMDFLLKPVSDTVLLAAVARGCEVAVQRHARRDELRQLNARVDRLTPREREVMAWVVTGRLNKQVACELGTVEKTIKAHRARVMRKLEVTSLPELVRIADKIGLAAIDEGRPPH